MFFSLDHLRFDYRPYPIGIAAPVMAEASYRRVRRGLPPMELFVGYGEMGAPGVKFTLSEKEESRELPQLRQVPPAVARVPSLAQVGRFTSMCSLRCAIEHVTSGTTSIASVSLTSAVRSASFDAGGSISPRPA